MGRAHLPLAVSRAEGSIAALKTPSLNPIRLPKEKILAATLIAQEWDSQEQILKPHSLPVVSGLLAFDLREVP